MFWDTLGYIVITIGVVFDLLGCIGLVRLPDVYNRLQASTKCVTLGTCSIMFGTFLMVGLTEFSADTEQPVHVPACIQSTGIS